MKRPSRIRRGRLYIVRDILRCAKEHGPIASTRLMYCANLAYGVFKPIRDSLTDNNCITISYRSKSGRFGYYTITDEGEDLLKAMDEVAAILNGMKL